MTKLLFVDIDHTISDSFWRDDMIGVASWDDYHEQSRHDLPLHDVCNVLNIIARSNEDVLIIGLTVRPEKFRSLTLNWLVSRSIHFDYLLMRPHENFRPAPEVKMQLARSFLEAGGYTWKDVMLVLDDRDDVAAAFKAEGVTVLQVHAKRGEAPVTADAVMMS